ncbi:hypothetical protein BDW75DRAFT_220274, partial [Aspergillus navahoensis]
MIQLRTRHMRVRLLLMKICRGTIDRSVQGSMVRYPYDTQETCLGTYIPFLQCFRQDLSMVHDHCSYFLFVAGLFPSFLVLAQD